MKGREMNNFVKWVIGFGMLLLAGNAAAIMISGTSGTGPVDADRSLQEITDLMKGYPGSCINLSLKRFLPHNS
jgi:hypothetical protein